jgi:hypothetical protein
MTHTQKELEQLITDYEMFGCVDKSKSLGIAEMPEGYALMLNADCTHYFWICHDGRESAIDWNRWRLLRGAKADKAAILAAQTGE